MRSFAALLCLLLFPPAAIAAEPGAAALFQTNCAACHGTDRLGLTGPALLPESLGRLRPEAAVAVVTKGRPATQMEGFAARLTPPEIRALVDYVYTPVTPSPRWDMAAIRASHAVRADPATLPARPVFEADPLNLFVVVESGDHHITILDGDRFEPLHREPTHFAVHGGPKFSPDGRFVYISSRDGWVSKFDLYSLRLVAEVRAGINARNIALSADGRIVAVANYLPDTLVLLDARDLSPIRVVEVADAAGTPSRVSAVYQAEPRGTFVAALKDVPEVWEIDTPALDRLTVRRIVVSEPLDDFFFDPDYRHLVGSSREGGHLVVVDLDTGREAAALDVPGMPHLGAGITWTWHGQPVMAVPHLKQSAISIIDMRDWTLLRQIKTLGPGYFIRGHERSRYAWADASLSAARDTLQIIDTETLAVVRTLRPEPGKTVAHVEFTRDGRHALASIWEMDGALVVYDAATFEEVKRIPMCKPAGKYNVFNKITRSAGTSH